MSAPRSENGRNGRDARGRFVKGCAGWPGNPHARRVAALRSALLARIGPAELGEIVAAMLEAARAGDVAAAKLLLSYSLGEPAALDLLARLEALEAAAARAAAAGSAAP